MPRAPISSDGTDGLHQKLGELIGNVKGLQNQFEEQSRERIRTEDRMAAMREAQYQQALNIQNGIELVKNQIGALVDRATNQDRATREVAQKVEDLQERMEQRVDELRPQVRELKSWQTDMVRYGTAALAVFTFLWVTIIKPIIEHGVSTFFGVK